MQPKLHIVGPGQGQKVDFGGFGVDFKISGESTGGRLSIVEHPVEAGRLVPPHVHHGEDELSYVIEGRFGVRIGDEIAEAGPGSYVLKPRGIPHTFWNPGPEPARLLEIIFPAGFERFFASLGDLAMSALDPDELARRREELGARFDLEFFSEWVDELKSKFGLRLIGEP